MTNAHPPGPPSGFLGLGHMLAMKRNLLDHVLELKRRYGDRVYYRIGPIGLYQFSHPDEVSEILVKKADAFIKPQRMVNIFRRWMGRGLLVNSGHDWRSQRRKVRSAQQAIDIKDFAATAVDQTRRLLAACTGAEHDFAALMDRLAFATGLRVMLGSAAEPVVERMHAAANTLHAHGIHDMGTLNLVPDWFPTAAKNALRRALSTFDGVLFNHLARRRQEPGPADLLSLMTIAEDKAGRTEGMTHRQARDEAVNLLMGGKETVAASITWAVYLLCRHPEVREQVVAEIDQVLSGGEPGSDALERLPLTTRVMKEAMRLYPPVFMLTGEAAEVVEIAGYTIRRGSQVHIPLYAIHRDPRWFDEPDAFQPDRFQPEREKQIYRYAYAPFGAGPRSCVGKSFGQLQGVLVLATLLSNYRVRLAPGQGEPAFAMDIVLHPRDGLQVCLEPRRAGEPTNAEQDCVNSTS